jgi:hypothetical protein
MTDERQAPTTHDPGPEKASGEVDSKAAGSKTGPPGNSDLDQAAVDQGAEKLGYVDSGH